MRHLTAWHYLVMVTIPLGMFLSLRFGLLGLVLFTAINLLTCYYCPDRILFGKEIPKRHVYELNIDVPLAL